jgi:hypothetical protein
MTVGHITLDLHGLLTIGLHGAGEREIGRLRRQLGPMPVVDARPADLVIEVVDRLSTDGTLVSLGRDAAYDARGLIIRRGRRQTDVRVRVPLERLGEVPLTITVERGAPAIPGLIPMVAMTALARGHVPVHASAFVHDGLGILVTGWAKGGKTEALLGFATRGETYVGDEWVFIAADGATMTGLPEPMRVWDWQLAQSPAIREQVGRPGRARLRAAAATTHLLRGAAGLPVLGGTAIGDAARRLGGMADRQRSIQVPPTEAFGGRVASGAVPLHAVVLIESTLDGVASVEPIDAARLARRVAPMVAHEWLDLEALLLAHRFAVPESVGPTMAAIEARLEAALAHALARVRAIHVRHPQPVELAGLADRLERALRDR